MLITQQLPKLARLPMFRRISRSKMASARGCPPPALTGDVHLYADVEGWRVVRTLRSEALSELQAVDTVHPVEAFGHESCLVGLQAADEMPGQCEIRLVFKTG